MTPALRERLKEICGPMFSPAKLDEIAALVGGDVDTIETLRALVHQIKGSDYRDRHGNPLEMNVAYRDAVALLELRG